MVVAYLLKAWLPETSRVNKLGCIRSNLSIRSQPPHRNSSRATETSTAEFIADCTNIRHPNRFKLCNSLHWKLTNLSKLSASHIRESVSCYLNDSGVLALKRVQLYWIINTSSISVMRKTERPLQATEGTHTRLKQGSSTNKARWS